MKLREILKLYNFRKFKKEKILLSFTALSIFIAVLVSLMVPQIAESHKRYMESNIRLLNGGDLKIRTRYLSNEFNEVIKDAIDKGFEVKSKDVETGFFYLDSGKKVVGSIIVDGKSYNKNSENDYNLKENEAVLCSRIAKNLNIKVGDKINVNASITGKREYTVKAIETLASGVDKDSEILGYGKLGRNKESLEKDKNLVTKNGMVIINGKEYKALSEKLRNVENGYEYTTLDERRKEVKGEISREVAVLSIVTTLSYILSALGIISTTIMLLIKRKRDIAILKMLNVSSKILKRSMKVELGIIVGLPLILASISSIYFSKVFLRINNIEDLCTLNDKLPIILKGSLFNVFMFLIILNVALLTSNAIQPLSIIREDQTLVKKYIKRTAKITILLIPVMLIVYAIFIGQISSALSSIGILLFILIFFVAISIILKLLQLVPFRNTFWIYSIKTIKKNFSSFVLVILSITLTLFLILIGFNMDKTIRDAFNKSVDSTLPYNYMIGPQEGENIDSILKNDANISGYSKLYEYEGKVLNKGVKFRSATIAQIKENEYGTKFKILEGNDIYEGEKGGCLVSQEFIRETGVKFGEILNIETEQGNVDIKIKGIYDGGKIDSHKIITDFVRETNDIGYIVKANNDQWTNKIKKSCVMHIGIVGESFAEVAKEFLKLFKGLCFIAIFSSLLFNINMGFMSYMGEERDETIIRALGIGRRFNIKHEIIKFFIVMLASVIMATTLYNLIINSILKGFMGVTSNISIQMFGLIIIISFVLGIISFLFPINKLNNNKSYTILREE
ncbi:putative ABC transport system permease protein [Clostridium cavendishii DSM 21758]|uniref:Putative ABC transport system permease protein n=1 Tax=Clostridium cavendishii DSM 21758 TaxID=1121302 RepID=A0A1M6CGL2_9CLOT|nr:hypothetical protein [Clostridium cavendishii]SHI60126.1 putative ABC transport system permease protein [Clostridium cavendishii DSM 21758]